MAHQRDNRPEIKRIRAWRDRGFQVLFHHGKICRPV